MFPLAVGVEEKLGGPTGVTVAPGMFGGATPGADVFPESVEGAVVKPIGAADAG
jgi:hypothetical protein